MFRWLKKSKFAWTYETNTTDNSYDEYHLQKQRFFYFFLGKYRTSGWSTRSVTTNCCSTTRINYVVAKWISRFGRKIEGISTGSFQFERNYSKSWKTSRYVGCCVLIKILQDFFLVMLLSIVIGQAIILLSKLFKYWRFFSLSFMYSVILLRSEKHHSSSTNLLCISYSMKLVFISRCSFILSNFTVFSLPSHVLASNNKSTEFENKWKRKMDLHVDSNVCLFFLLRIHSLNGGINKQINTSSTVWEGMSK